MSTADYYQILGLQPEATGAMVDEAYWHAARRLNTAAASDPSAAAHLDALNEAYRVLGSPELRQEYDQARERAWNPYRPIQGGESGACQPRAGWTADEGVGHIASGILRAANRWRISISNHPFGLSHGLGAASVLVMLTLAILAWAAGADPSPVAAMLVLGICIAALVLVVPNGGAAPDGKQSQGSKGRPSNLHNVTVPGAMPRSLRKRVYGLYEQCPHLGPAQAAAVARYVCLTRRFMWFERVLREGVDTEPEGELRPLLAEQRALASELRHLEAALGVTGEGEPAQSGHPGPREPGADQSDTEFQVVS